MRDKAGPLLFTNKTSPISMMYYPKKHGSLLVVFLILLNSVYSSITTPDSSSSDPSSSDTVSNTELSHDLDPLFVDSSDSQMQEETSSENAPIAANAEVSISPQRILDTDETKGDNAIADEDVDPFLDLPSRLFEVIDADSVDTRKRQNYASLDAGATILDASPETKSPTNLLVPDKDRYMLTPCSNPRKWVVISLSEDVHADAIAVANYEKFSSPVKDFIVLGSVNYPTDTWFVLGNFTATLVNGEQTFQLDGQQHVRYIKFRFLSYYGSEYYCTLSQLRVFGRTFTQVISELEKSIDAEVEALDAQAAIVALEESALPGSAKNVVPRILDPAELISQCLMEQNNTVVAVFYDKSQQIEYYRNHGMCCIVDYIPEQTGSEVAANDHLSTSSPDLVESDVSDDAVQVATSIPNTNAPNAFVIDGSGVDTTTPSTGTVSSSLLPAAHSIAVSSTQSLGPLESIFVRITKKIQALEANQSVMGRQLEELHTHQWAAIKMLQSNKESVTDQLQEIRTLIVDLKENVAKELSDHEQTLLKYGRLLDDVRRDNVALWNEMLIVREVITSMKAGILCAIILSGFIILFYLLRLLFRCVSKCKERADLREWFYRMQNYESSVGGSTSLNGSDGNIMAAGALRVNRKAQFGLSWDDLAIERKTLVSDMVGNGHRRRKRVQASH